MKNRNRYYLDTKTNDVVLARCWITNGIESGGSVNVMRLRDSHFYSVSYANEASALDESVWHA